MATELGSRGLVRRAIAGVVCIILLTSCACASAPAQNVSAARHPNLAAAQRLCGDAFQRINSAQQANEFDLGGHAQRAKDLLVQAADELKQAALASNAHGH
jgi:hypothetical protein